MIRITKVPTTQTPSTTKPFLSHTLRYKTRPVFLSQPVDIFDETNCDSTKAILLEKHEHDPSPSPTVKSATNLLGTKRAFTRAHSTFPEDSKKLITEEHNDVKVNPSAQHSTIVIINLFLNPSQFTFLTFVLHLMTHLKIWINLISVISPAPPTNLNETCSFYTSCDHLLHLDSSSLSSELQDTSSVESVEIEFVPDFEEPLESNKISSTEGFSVQHDYDLFLLNEEIDTPSDNLNHQDTHVCEKQGQDEFLIHAADLSHNFALPQFMPQHNCEDLKPIDTPSTFSTITQASSDHTSNQICAHNPMETQCNQSQYLTLVKTNLCS